MNNASNIKKNVLYNTLLSVSQFLFPVVTFPYISRVLGPAGVGTVGFVDSLTQYFTLFAALGIPIYGVREIAKYRNNRDSLSKLFIELVGIHLFFAFILSVIYIILFHTVPKLYEDRILFWIGTLILIVNVFPTEWYFQGIEQFSFVVKRTLIIRLLSVALIFLLVRSSNDAVWYYGINLITLFFNALINGFFVLRRVELKFKGLNFKQHFKPLLLIFSSNVAISIYILMDSIILGFMANSDEVGYYTTSVKLNRIALSVITAFSLVMIPRLSFAFKERDFSTAQSLLKNSFEYIIFVSIPICIGMFVLAPEIISVFAGKDFTPSVMVLRITSPLIIFIGLSNIYGMQVLVPMSKEGLLLKGVLVGMTISILMNLILIPIYKHNGAAFTSSFTELIVTIITGYFAIKQFRFTTDYRCILQAIVACLIFWPITYMFSLMNMNVIMRLISIVSLCGICYLSIQYFVFRSDVMFKFFSFFRSFFNRKLLS